VLPFTLTCALLYRAGVFDNFWFWTFSYASHYATAVSLRTGLGALTDNFSDILRFTKWLWLLALVGVFGALWNPTARRHAVFVFGLLLFSFAVVCRGLYFRTTILCSCCPQSPSWSLLPLRPPLTCSLRSSPRAGFTFCP